MSDQPLSRDELASALLDGAVAAPSAVDEALTARVDELRQAAEAIGAPVTIDDEARERAIAAALAEFDAPAADLPVAAASVAATRIAPTPMPQRRRVLPVLAGAAAAVVVLVGGVAVLQQRDDSNPTEAASIVAPLDAASGGVSAASTTMAPSAAGANADAAESASPANPPAPAPAAPDLGEISNDEQLRAALGAESFTTKAANVNPDACEAAVRASVSDDLGTLTGSVTLRWQDQPARAIVFVGATGAPHIVVVADPGCEVLDRIG